MRCVLPLLLFVLLPGVNKTNAQQAKTITGTFATPVRSPGYRLTEVHYTMTLSATKDKLTIETKSTDKTLFGVDVLNSDNKVLLHWTPETQCVNCSHTFDISRLAAGNYHLNINNNHSNTNNNQPNISAARSGINKNQSNMNVTQPNIYSKNVKSYNDISFAK